MGAIGARSFSEMREHGPIGRNGHRRNIGPIAEEMITFGDRRRTLPPGVPLSRDLMTKPSLRRLEPTQDDVVGGEAEIRCARSIGGRRISILDDERRIGYLGKGDEPERGDQEGDHTVRMPKRAGARKSEPSDGRLCGWRDANLLETRNDLVRVGGRQGQKHRLSLER